MAPDINLILSQAKNLYQVELLHEITSGYSGDYIFETNAGLRSYILRIAKFSKKKQAHTEFETRWTEYLASRMEGIAKPVRSANNRLYEVVEAGGKEYILSLQEKAPGKIVDIHNPKEFNQSLFFHLGILMGRMHKLTMCYEGNQCCPEFKWNGPHFWRSDIPVLDEDVRQGEKLFLKELECLPTGKDNYGIVHFDIHTDNFLAENKRITLIDFDACQFNWYAADMASAMFFMVQKGAGPLKRLTEKARTEFAEAYLFSYLKGYLQTNSINAYWIRKMDLFMRYQMVDEYVAAQIGWPEESAHQKQWYMDWYKERIKNHLPYVFIDYEKILDKLSNLMLLKGQKDED